MSVNPRLCEEGQELWICPSKLTYPPSITKATVVTATPHSLVLITPQTGPKPRRFKGQALDFMHTTEVGAWAHYADLMRLSVKAAENETARRQRILAAAEAACAKHGGRDAVPPPPPDPEPEED